MLDTGYNEGGCLVAGKSTDREIGGGHMLKSSQTQIRPHCEKTCKTFRELQPQPNVALLFYVHGKHLSHVGTVS